MRYSTKHLPHYMPRSFYQICHFLTVNSSSSLSNAHFLLSNVFSSLSKQLRRYHVYITQPITELSSAQTVEMLLQSTSAEESSESTSELTALSASATQSQETSSGSLTSACDPSHFLTRLMDNILSHLLILLLIYLFVHYHPIVHPNIQLFIYLTESTSLAIQNVSFRQIHVGAMWDAREDPGG